MVVAAMVPSAAGAGAGARHLQQAATVKCSFLEESLQCSKQLDCPVGSQAGCVADRPLLDVAEVPGLTAVNYRIKFLSPTS